MLDVVKALTGMFNLAIAAGTWSADVTTALARLCYYAVSGICHAAVHLCHVASTVVVMLSHAAADVLFYIWDLFLEVLDVLEACIKLGAKLGVLALHAGGIIAQGLHVAFGWIFCVCKKGLGVIFGAITNNFHHLSTAANYMWHIAGKCVNACQMGLWSVGAQASAIATLAFQSVASYMALLCGGIWISAVWVFDTVWIRALWFLKNVWDYMCAGADVLYETTKAWMCKLKTVTSKSVNSQYVQSIPFDTYVAVLITILVILLLKILFQHLHKVGLTFPSWSFIHAEHIELPNDDADTIFLDSSDEDDVGADQQENVYESDQDDDNDTDIDDDNISDQSDEEDETDDDISEEFEIADDTESDQSDEELQPIIVQLPQRVGGYSLRTRASPGPEATAEKLSKVDVERIIESERDKRSCVVCQDQVKTVLVLPCKHMCLCVDCAHEIAASRLRGRRACPLCRAPIETLMNVFV